MSESQNPKLLGRGGPRLGVLWRSHELKEFYQHVRSAAPNPSAQPQFPTHSPGLEINFGSPAFRLQAEISQLDPAFHRYVREASLSAELLRRLEARRRVAKDDTTRVLEAQDELRRLLNEMSFARTIKREAMLRAVKRMHTLAHEALRDYVERRLEARIREGVDKTRQRLVEMRLHLHNDHWLQPEKATPKLIAERYELDRERLTGFVELSERLAAHEAQFRYAPTAEPRAASNAPKARADAAQSHAVTETPPTQGRPLGRA